MTFRFQDTVLLSWAVCLSGLMSLQSPSQSSSVTLMNSVLPPAISLYQCSLFSWLRQGISPPHLLGSAPVPPVCLFPSEQPLLKLKSNICPQSKEEIGSLRKKIDKVYRRKSKPPPILQPSVNHCQHFCAISARLKCTDVYLDAHVTRDTSR